MSAAPAAIVFFIFSSPWSVVGAPVHTNSLTGACARLTMADSNERLNSPRAMAASRPARKGVALDATSADTKTRILDAAEELFTEHGFEATSLRQLTAAAGVN